MKKILSLTLVAIMLLSITVLTSCDIETILNIASIVNSTTTSTNNSTSNLPVGSPQDVRTTITEEEWVAAMSMKNYTEIVTLYNGNIAYSVAYTEEGCFSPNGTSAFVYGCIYFLEKSDDSWVAKNSGSFEIFERLLPLMLIQDVWSDLTYDEATKMYVTNDKSLTFAFEDGVLVAMGKYEIVNGAPVAVASYEFVDIGTTVVELPEYTFETPIEYSGMSFDEFYKLVSVTNFSIDYTIFENQDDQWVNAHHIDAKYDGVNKFFDMNGYINGQRYNTVIDGVGYEINYYNGGYFAKKVGENVLTDAEALIHSYWAQMFYPHLKCIDENVYAIEYVFEDESPWYIEITVEDGQVVAMTEIQIILENNQKLVTYYFDIGTTVVELPEFTFAE